MSKKQEWRDKYKKEIRRASFTWPPSKSGEEINDELADFMHSLHLQEIEKIRDMIKARKAKGYTSVYSSVGQAMDELLLAITDEK